MRRGVVGVRGFRRVVKRLFDKAFRRFNVALTARRLDEKEAREEVIGGVASLVGVGAKGVRGLRRLTVKFCGVGACVGAGEERFRAPINEKSTFFRREAANKRARRFKRGD